jgi:hypothetical protein
MAKFTAVQRKARARLAKAKIKMAMFQRKARREMARMSVVLKRHQRALKAASKSYKRSLAR